MSPLRHPLTLLAMVCVLSLTGCQRPVVIPENLYQLSSENLLKIGEEVVRRGERTLPDLASLDRLRHYFEIRFDFSDDSLGPRDHERGVWRGLARLERREIAKLDVAQLRQLAANCGYEMSGFRQALQRRWLEAEIARIVSDPKRRPILAENPDSKYVPMGPWRDEAEQRRVLGRFDQWRTARYAVRTQKAESAQSEKADWPAYCADCAAVLHDQRKNMAGVLAEFDPRFPCAVGSEWFYEDRSTLVFMALLQEDRIAEAVGASFLVPDAPEWLREPGQPYDTWRIELLKFSGLDWQQTLADAGRTDFLAAAKQGK